VSDRRTELQRQRSLILERLARLDRELAALEAKTPAPIPVAALPPAEREDAASPSIPAAPRATSTDASAAEIAADEIIERYRKENPPQPNDVKRGCIIYFAAALGLLVLVVFAWYLIKTR